jgi:hypothetical protein
MEIDIKQDRGLVERLPQFIAVNYQAMLDAPDEESIVRYGLLAFDRMLRFLTVYMTSQEFNTNDPRQVTDRAITKRVSGLFFDSDIKKWHEILVSFFGVYKGKRDLLFIPELYDFYWESTNARNPQPSEQSLKAIHWLITQHYRVTQRIKLPANHQEWKELAQETLEYLRLLLLKIQLPPSYDLVCVLETADGWGKFERHMGLEIEICEHNIGYAELVPGRYYLVHDLTEFLELTPLLAHWRNQNPYTAILELDERGGLVYLLANSILDETWIDYNFNLGEFHKLKSKINKHIEVKIHWNAITWLELRDLAHEKNHQSILKAKDRFSDELYQQRNHLMRTFLDFFEKSDRNCFVLTGESGVGKSSFILSLVEHLKRDDPDVILLMVKAGQIDPRAGLNKYIVDQVILEDEESKNQIGSIWPHVAGMPEQNSHKFLLIIDAINENQSPKELLQQINELLYKKWKWLKIVITSRPQAWNHLVQGVELDFSEFYQPVRTQADLRRTNYSAYNLMPFNDQELREAYLKYQTGYHLKTNFDDLNLSTRKLLSLPLQMWIIANTFEERQIPNQLIARQLIPKYLQNVQDRNKLSKRDLEFLEESILPEIVCNDGIFTNEVRGNSLIRAGKRNLKERIFSQVRIDQDIISIDQDFVSEEVSHLETVVILKRTYDPEPVLSFNHERFYDYFLGEYFFKKVIYPEADKGRAFHQLFQAIEKYPFIYGGVEHAMYLLAKQNSLAIDALVFIDKHEDAQLISSALDALAQEDPDTVRAFASRVIDQALNPDQKATFQMKAQAIETALSAAATVEADTQFIYVLTHPDKLIRELGVKHAYYLRNNNPDLLKTILRKTREKTLQKPVLPDLNGLLSIFQIALLLLLDAYKSRHGKDPKIAQSLSIDPLAKDGLDEINAILTTLSHRPLLRLGNWLFQTVLAQVGTSFLLNLTSDVEGKTSKNSWNDPTGNEAEKQGKKSRTINNFNEMSLFFKQPANSPIRQKVYSTLSYMKPPTQQNPELGKMAVELYQISDRISENMADYMTDIYGIFYKEEGKKVLEYVEDNLIDPSNNKYLYLCARWYSIIERQPEVTQEDLDTMRRFACAWMDQTPGHYGTIQRRDSEYQYYPINLYGALWTRANPGQPIDIYEQYLNRAFETNDQALELHLIDMFGDVRNPWTEFIPTLRLLQPFLDKGEPYRKHIVESLGGLHRYFSEDVEHFIIEVELKPDLANSIRSYSFRNPSSDLYMRFSQLIDDLMAYAPLDFRQKVLGILDKALRASSLDRMIAILLQNLLSTFIFKKQAKG